MDFRFSYVCPVIDNEFRHNIVKVVCGIHSYFDNVMTKFMINNRTDAWKIDANLLIREKMLYLPLRNFPLLYYPG